MRITKIFNCEEVHLQKAGCVGDFVAILLSNGYTVKLKEKDNKIIIRILEEKENESN
jgi:hypothetical protein